MKVFFLQCYMVHLPACTVCRYVGQWQTGGRSWWSRHWGESLPETTPPPAAARNGQGNNSCLWDV